ncbi:MAG: bifunctional oligoribonuclease/PAP phosphatase NrnA [Lachnospiraceae bacterium]|nr:bifunctional oligoribonuclease/PAP phosphatase NrnA [Lachnospiraceae bacterium]
MIDLLKECEGAKQIAISGHIRPDGDCVGATMALYQYLTKAMKGVRVEVLLETPPPVFADIVGASDIITEKREDTVYDVFFVVDSVPDRIGFAYPYFQRAKKTINIDHHISNEGGICDLEYIVPDASSASELVYDLLDKTYIDTELAKTIYTGIIHDTGVFQYSNTSPKTMRIVAQLLEYGFDFPKLIEETFYEKTYLQSQILGRTLLESILLMEGQCAVGVVSKKTMEFYDVSSKDFEGIVNQLRIIKGVEVAIFMYEQDTLNYKVSLRSGGRVDVSKVAQYFGGGGHVRAAGCNISGTYRDAINNLTAQIEKQL